MLFGNEFLPKDPNKTVLGSKNPSIDGIWALKGKGLIFEWPRLLFSVRLYARS